ncbi:MAG: sensor domain-containing diguanylate cyclase [Oscillospiraceae bacterium]|nr:sensor domain-containing diguanylate cyclase [Oscillospiraceae bacterium]
MVTDGCNKISSAEEAQLNGFMNAAPCGLCQLAYDPDLTILSANNLFYTMFHYTPAQAAAEKFSNLRSVLKPDTFQSLQNALSQAKAENLSFFEMKIDAVCRNGQTKFLLTRCSLQQPFDGHMLWGFFDITKQQKLLGQLYLGKKLCLAASQQREFSLSCYNLHTHTLVFPYGQKISQQIPNVLHQVPERISASKLLTDSNKKILNEFFASISTGELAGSCVIAIQLSQAETPSWFELKYTLAPASAYTDAHAIITCQNITEQHEKEITYEQYRQCCEEMQKGHLIYFECDLMNNRIVRFECQNSSLQALASRCPYYSEFCKNFSNSIYLEDRSQYLNCFSRGALIKSYQNGHSHVTAEYRYTSKSGKLIWYSSHAQLIEDSYSKSLKAFIRVADINSQKQYLLKLKKNARQDPLTNLLNRRALIKNIQQTLRYSPYNQHAFIMIDVDHFKYINDSFGHQFGDHVLRNISTVLQRNIGSKDICGRLGGDEFVIFLHSISSIKSLANHIARLSSCILQRYNKDLTVSVCMGIAIAPKDGRNFNELYKTADTALYQAKHSGPNHYAFYHSN